MNLNYVYDEFIGQLGGMFGATYLHDVMQANSSLE
jgi:hypothetical protein